MMCGIPCIRIDSDSCTDAVESSRFVIAGFGTGELKMISTF